MPRVDARPPLRILAGPARPDPVHVARVKAWVRTRFGLPPEALVVVTQLPCGEPGCSPSDTMIALSRGEGEPRWFKLAKAVADVTAADLAGLPDVP